MSPDDSPFEQALIQLARITPDAGTSLRELWSQVAGLAAATLQVERVGAWLLIDEGRALRCLYLLQQSSAKIYQGAVLRQQDFPTYFRSLLERRTIAADDASASPLTSELSASYLAPLAITSMLDAPIYLEGRLAGVLCHEHTGAPRTWSEAQCSFASAVADNIARLYEAHQRRQVQNTLSVYQRHLTQLHRMEAIGRMAAGVAHDFRGVMTIALGFAELIRRVPDLPQQADEYAQRAIEALQRGRQLSQEIVAFGKDEPASPRVLDVNTVVSHASTMFRVLLGPRVKIDWRPRSVSRVFADPAQLERALLNLVLNARDAMPDGGELRIEIEEVRLDDESEAAPYVALKVADTGQGMDEETMAQARNPFFTTKGECGTGLGLVIVDQIVARAGGRMKIDSAPGSGTTVSLYLPPIAAADPRSG